MGSVGVASATAPAFAGNRKEGVMRSMKEMAMKDYDSDVIGNVACLATTAMVMVSNILNPLSGDAAMVAGAAVGWTQTTMTEVVLGGLGGLLGGVAFAWATPMKSPLNMVVGTALAAMWAALLGPILVHVGMVLYPAWITAASDPIVSILAGAIIGAGGMPIYLLILALVSALKDKLPALIERLAARFLGGPKA